MADARPAPAPAPRALTAPPFWLVVAFAFAVRVAFAAFALWPVRWDDYGIDHGSELGSIARNLYEGRGFSSPFGAGAEPTAWLAPLVPVLWVALFKVLGLFSEASLVALLALQMLASALCVGLYVAIARWSLERAQVRWRSALWWLALGFALWPESLERQTHMWYYPFQEFALAWLFLEGLRWIEQPDRRRGLRLGIAAGILASINPGPLPFFALLLGVVLVRRRRSLRAVLRPVALAALACAALLTPWTVRNALVFGAFVPLRSNLGLELLQGNGPRGTIFQRHDSQHPAVDRSERGRYERLGELEYMRTAQAEALAHIRAHSGLFTARTLERAVLYWTSDFLDRWTWTPRPPWWQSGGRAIARRLVKLASLWTPLIVLIVALLRGRGRQLPGLAAYAGLLLAVPLPYYLTHLHEAYSFTVRPYVLLLALLLLAVRPAGSPAHLGCPKLSGKV